MAHFKMDFSQAKNSLNDFDNVLRTLESLKKEAKNVADQIDFKIKARPGIMFSLNSFNAKAESLLKKGQNTKTGLELCIRHYENAENKLLGNKISDVPTNVGNAGDTLKDYFMKFFGKAGLVGATAGMIDKFIGGVLEPSWKNVLEFTKSGIKFMEKAVGAAKKAGSVTQKWSSLFGAETKTAQEVVDGALDKFSFAKDKVKASASWATVAVNGIINFIDNKEEFEGTGNTGRMVAETITETAVDAALDIGLTTAIGAGLVAVGVATGPVGIIAAVGAVGAKMALDATCNWLVGKDFTEAVSDVIVDHGMAVAEDIQEVGKGFITGIKDVTAKWPKFCF